jgi:outer membrane protein OmpA-like peptidoglycan-associated protein
MKPTPADRKASKEWAIARLRSVGAGVSKASVGLALFDLLNREAMRAHRLTLAGGGGGLKPGVSGSFTASPYSYFTTAKHVSFKDFDGIFMKFDKKDYGIWSKAKLTIREGKSPLSAVLAEVTVKGWAAGIPGKEKLYGITEVHYSNGKMYDPGGAEYVPPAPGPSPVDPPGSKSDFKERDYYVVPAGLAFDFDSWQLKSTARDILEQAGEYVKRHWNGIMLVHVVGHSDSIGSVPYNQLLSEKRAQAVAKWLRDNNYVPEQRLNPVGFGETKPRAPNRHPDGRDYPQGRELNRRVEIEWAT